MPCLLVRKRVHDRVTKFEVFVRRNGVEILDEDTGLYARAATLHLHGDHLADSFVEDCGERHEFRDEFAVDADKDIARRQHFRGGRAGPRLAVLLAR